MEQPAPACIAAPAAFVVLLTLAGCAAVESPREGKLFEREGVAVVVIPESSRETYFSDVPSLERFCRAPSSDVSITASEGISISAPALVGGKGATGGVSQDASRGALALGGRDPAVLITRELMYRACELTNNLSLSKAEALKLYRDTLEAIIKISATQTSAGTTAASANANDPRVVAPAASVSKPAPVASTPTTTPADLTSSTPATPDPTPTDSTQSAPAPSNQDSSGTQDTSSADSGASGSSNASDSTGNGSGAVDSPSVVTPSAAGGSAAPSSDARAR